METEYVKEKILSVGNEDASKVKSKISLLNSNSKLFNDKFFNLVFMSSLAGHKKLMVEKNIL